MPNRDVFAFDRSGFNGFLFAAIGTEADGSRLTVVSALARLGEDPWAKAASWARMSKAAAGEALAACIAQMPVTPEDLLAAPSTAARLVLLLSPAAVATRPDFLDLQPGAKFITLMVVVACTSILLGGALLISRPDAATPAPSAEPAALRVP